MEGQVEKKSQWYRLLIDQDGSCLISGATVRTRMTSLYKSSNPVRGKGMFEDFIQACFRGLEGSDWTSRIISLEFSRRQRSCEIQTQTRWGAGPRMRQMTYCCWRPVLWDEARTLMNHLYGGWKHPCSMSNHVLQVTGNNPSDYWAMEFYRHCWEKLLN